MDAARKLTSRILNTQQVYIDYVLKGESDRELAERYDVERTIVSKYRKKHGINTRLMTGEIGERLVLMELQRLGFSAVDMNLAESKTHGFDILVNGSIKVEVKTARALSKGSWRFALTCASNKYTKQSKNSIRLPNGRRKKLFMKTCDVVILCGISNKSVMFFVIPPLEIPFFLNTITVSNKGSGKWGLWKDRWDLILDAVKHTKKGCSNEPSTSIQF